MKPSGYRKAKTEDPADLITLAPVNSASYTKKQQEPMDRFRRYEEEFLNSSRIITTALRSLGGAKGNVDLIISSSVEAEAELSEAEGYLRAMDVEFRTMMNADKKNASQKVTEYRDEFKQLRQNFDNTKHQAEAEALKTGPAARNRLVTANQRLDDSTMRLEQSRMLIGQTEQVGNTIITDLESQKETLQDASKKVQETKQFTVDARGVLKDMTRRALMHKLACLLVIITLLGLIGVTAYYGILKKSDK